MMWRTACAGLLLVLMGVGPAMAGAIAVLQHQPGDPSRPWTWAVISSKLDLISKTGFTAILLSPHQKSCGGNKSLGYDPYDYTSFESAHGTEVELRALIKKAHVLKIQVYADMVLNHMCAGINYRYPRFTKEHFHTLGKIQDFNNQNEVENGALIGLDDLRQEMPYVRGELWKFILKTKDVGFDGYRWDAAKHVPRWYWRDHVLLNPIGRGAYNFGEVYSGDYDYLFSYISLGMAVTDYPLYFQIRDNFRAGGSFYRVNGAGIAVRDGLKALTFVENHDVGPPPYRRLAQAFIAVYPGYPAYFNVLLPDQWLENVVWLQNHLAAGAGDYQQRYVERDVLIFTRGDRLLAGFNKSTSWTNKWVQTPWKNATLHDHTGHVMDEVTDNSGRVEVWIPPMGYIVMAPMR